MDNIPYSGNSYIDYNPDYSSQHGVNDVLYPKNSLCTYISGSSRLVQLNMWNSVDSYEKSLKEELETYRNILSSLPEYIRDISMKNYKIISDVYHVKKKKKSKIKIYCYSLFMSLKITGQFVSHISVSSILQISPKIVCKSIKCIDEFVSKNGVNIKLDSSMDINYYIDKLDIDILHKNKIYNIYVYLDTHQMFNHHRKDSLLSGIISLYCPNIDKKFINETIQVSATTIYQIHKKIESVFPNNSLEELIK